MDSIINSRFNRSVLSFFHYINERSVLVQCPKGTYIENNECKFCRLNTYQDEAGRTHCIECPVGQGTTIYGATDKQYCKYKGWYRWC